MKTKAIFVSLLVVTIALTACGVQEPLVEEALVIKDDFGREVAIPAVPNNIVSLSPSNTEILFALGLGERVVGVTEHDNFPPEVVEIPKVGGFATPNLEVIIAMEPDLVLADSIHQQLVEDLEQLEIPVLAFEPLSVEGVYDTIIRIGAAAGEEGAAEDLVASMREEVAEIIAPIANLSDDERPMVYYEIWHDPIITIGPQTYIHDLLEMAGGKNIAADAQKAWPEYSLEALIQKNPEVIISPQNRMDGVGITLEDYINRPGWQDIKAVQEGQIFFVEDDLVSRAGPRLTQGLRQLVSALHPDTDTLQ